MKKSLKIWFLILAVALLAAIFAVTALAAEEKTATVVYPDGTEVICAVGETIVPPASEGGLYYGKGNTLYKDDATAGWLYTLEGESAALSDLTVTDAMAGKRILASGFNQVYYTSEEFVSAGTVTVYHLKSDLNTYLSTSNKGDRGDGTNVGANSYEELRKTTTQKVVVKLYADMTYASFSPDWNSSTNPLTGRPCYLDLNGHSVTTTQQKHINVKGIYLYIYSSKAGAHWYHKDYTGGLTRPDDNGRIYLGDDGSGLYCNNISFHVRQVFAQQYGHGEEILGGIYYQTGPSSFGGLVEIGRRLFHIKNATFYLYPGEALLTGYYKTDSNYQTDGYISGGTSAITNCTFYADGEAPILKASNPMLPKFSNCNFVNVRMDATGDASSVLSYAAGCYTNLPPRYNVGASGTSIYARKNEAPKTVALTLADGTAKSASLYYSTAALAGGVTVTYPDGQSQLRLVGETLSWIYAPKLYEENGRLYYKVSEVHTLTKSDGTAIGTDLVTEAMIGESVSASSEVVYDAVVFSVTRGDTVTYHTEREGYAQALAAYLGAMENGATVKLYSDVTLPPITVAGQRTADKAAAEGASFALDLAGYTVTFSGSGVAMRVLAPGFSVYSSAAGGAIVAESHALFVTDTDDYKWIGGAAYGVGSTEYAASALSPTQTRGFITLGAEYGENLTVTVASINTDTLVGGAALLGGTYLQSEGISAPYFLYLSHTDLNIGAIRSVSDVTVVLRSSATAPLYYRSAGSVRFENCRFLSLDGAARLLSDANGVLPSTPVFVGCDFYDIIPARGNGDREIVYTDCAFGFSSAAPAGDLDPTNGAAYLIEGEAKEMTVLGTVYTLDHILRYSSLPMVTVSYPDGTRRLYAVGESIEPYLMADTYFDGGDLYKCIGEGWTYLLNGTPLASDIIPAEAAGKMIAATGYRYGLVYYTSVEQTARGTVLVYHLKDDIEVYLSAQNLGDRGDGTNTGAFPYTELRKSTTAAVTITLYRDITLEEARELNPSWYDKDNRISGCPCYLDLNGHSITLAQTAKAMLTGIKLYIYSSVPGAEWHAENAKEMFCVDNDASLYLGANSASAQYKDNITFYGRSLFVSIYGGGAYIYGGTYRQSAPASYFIEVARRIYALENADFYLADGSVALLGDTSSATAYTANAFKNCTFTAESSVYMLYALEGRNTPYSFTGCTLTGILDSAIGGECTVLMPDGTKQKLVLGDTVTLPGAQIAYTDESGVLYALAAESWYLTDAAGARLATMTVSPAMIGSTYTLKSEHTYKRVLFTVSVGEATDYYINEQTLAEDLMDLLAAIPSGAQVTLYSDVTVDALRVTNPHGTERAAVEFSSQFIDLNGHTLTVEGAGRTAIDSQVYRLFIYSSKAGAEILAPGYALVSASAYTYRLRDGREIAVKGGLVLGEREEGASVYGKNLSALCRGVCEGDTGGTVSLIGVTLRQSENTDRAPFFHIADMDFGQVRGLTLLLTGRTDLFHYEKAGLVSLESCRFINTSSEAISLFFEKDNALGAPIFDGCDFFGIYPAASIGAQIVGFNDCAFGFVGMPDTELGGGAILSQIPSRTVLIGSTPYILSYAVMTASGEGVTIVYPDGTEQFCAVGATILPLMNGASYLGKDGLTYADAGEGWCFSLDGTALTDLTVTADMAGKTVTATGYVRVYFSTTVDGATTYYTNASTYATQFKSYMAAMDPGVTVRLYSDITVSSMTVSGKRIGSYALAMSASYTLDIGGYTLTFTGTGSYALEILAAKFYLYSSLPGGRIHSEKMALMRTNNDDYKWIDGAAFGQYSTTYNEAVDITPTKPSAVAYIGELSPSAVTYGSNLTVVCASVNADMYGTGAYFLGGTFIQSESSTATYFMLLSRTTSASGHIKAVQHTTFVTVKSTTAMLNYKASSAVKFNDCRFICTAGAPAPLLYERDNISTSPSFTGCLFYDVLPVTSHGILELRYTDCAFGFSGDIPSEDMDAREKYTAYFAPTAEKQYAYGDTVYTFNVTPLISETGFLSVRYPDGSYAIFYVGEIIRPPAESATFISGGSLYADLGAGWQYMLNGAALTDLTVTADMVNQTVTATGYARVFFYVEANGATVYYTDADTYSADLSAYLGAMDAGAKIVLCEDVSIAPLVIQGARIADRTAAMNASYYLDLNGHTLTFTGSGVAMTLRTAYFYLYSSVEGGKILAESHTLFNTDNDDYRWVDGAAVLPGSEAYANSTASATKPSAVLVLGESELGTVRYGDNLTAVTAKVNGNLSGTGVVFCGGTFIQSESSAEPYFVCLSRIPKLDGTYTVSGATFILNHAGTAMFSSNSGTTIRIEDCRFISTAGEADLFLDGMTSYPSLSFTGCGFYDLVLNAKVGTKAVTYTDCALGFSKSVRSEGVLIAHSADAVYAEGYLLDCRTFTDFSEVTTVIWGEYLTEYWMEGTTPYCDTSLFDRVQVYEDGTAYLTAGAILDGSYILPITVDMLGKTHKIPVSYMTVLPVAFTYADASGALQYVLIPEGADATALGLLFHETFDECGGAYTITLHADILLTKGIGWGPSYTNGNGVPEYKSLYNGSVTLDLNGFTLTVSADCAAINASNSNSTSTYPKKSHGIFAFEVNTDSTFTLTSSRPGAKILNLSDSALFVLGESGCISLTVEGENLSIESNGTVFLSFETYSSKTAPLTVTGGSYTYHGTASPIVWVGSACITDAEIYLTGAAVSVFGANHYKRSSSLTVTDTQIYCTADTTKLFAFFSFALGESAPTMTTSITHTVALKDCIYIGGAALPTEIENVSALTYEGMAIADASHLLTLYGGTAPADTSLAYLERIIDGTAHRLYQYLAESEVGYVDWGFGLSPERWKLGESATHPNTVIGDVFGYGFLPTAVDAAAVKGGSRVIALRPGTLRMSLTLQGTIGINLYLAESLGATEVTVAGTSYDLSAMTAAGGYYAFVASVAPNYAHVPVAVAITVGAYTHTVPVSIEQYAAALLNTDAYASAHDLTYAMVEHVEAQTGTRFTLCKPPVGYRRAEPTPYKHANDGLTLLDGIAILPDGTISIALRGEVGTEIYLSLASGRGERRTMTEGVIVIDGIYINEFFGEMTVRASKDGVTEVYTYSLENYLYYQTDAALIERVSLLYNYTYYAHVYADTLTGVRIDKNKDHYCDLCERSRSAHTDAAGDGVCDHCGAALTWSEGLVFTENADGSYTVSGLGDCTDAILVIPETYLGMPVSAIGEGALAGCTAQKIVLPDSIRQIGASALAGCASLEILTVGSGLREIGDGAFADCAALSTVYYNGRAAGWRAITNSSAIGATVFFYSEYLPETDGYFWYYGEDGAVLTYCRDLDHDHLCDDCDKTLTVCLDESGDHICDICGAVLSSCADADSDHLCDLCDAVLSRCADADSDHLCDVCGKTLSVCINAGGDHDCDICGERITDCLDNNRDHICEICGETASAPTDADGDHLCDICNAVISLCGDTDGDHICDICYRLLSYHKDVNGDHLCEICGETVSVHTDADHDSLCDLCGRDFEGHEDTDGDHLCDLCLVRISDCADAGSDHICDLCGASLAHKDLNGDHLCEICGSRSACEDLDGDHLCDLCDQTLSTCADADRDHLCDTCAQVLTVCADANGDHLCDICASALSSCADADADHLCDACGKVISFCRDGGDATCTLCGRLLASEGLRYRQKSDGTYAVIGLGDCKDPYIYIPKTYNGAAVTEIAKAAFAARRGIIGVSIPDSVEVIGLGAFAACVDLSEVVVGDGVKNIPLGAFFLCGALREVTLGDGVEVIGLGAFADCMSVESVSFGESVRLLQLGAFAGCVKLESIVLPEGLETVGLGAFSGCSALKRVVLPTSLVRLGHAAFDRATALESVCYGGTAEGFDSIAIADKNRPVHDAGLHLYTDTEPAGQGRYWYYGEGGAIVTVTLCPAHTDANRNLICDLCGAMTVCEHVMDASGSCTFCNHFVCITHKDYNRDLACDICDASVPCEGHLDADVSGTCDACGAAFTCKAHADANADGFCDICALLMGNTDFGWESEQITFEMSLHTAGGIMTSRSQSFMAGEAVLADTLTEQLILARNAAAYEATGVSVLYKYLPNTSVGDLYAWSKNYERIAVQQDSGIYSDVYCNFGYDMLGASLLGCFANLKTEGAENHFDFAVNEYYAETVGDSDGYMYEYMQSLAFDGDRMYLMASDYLIDTVRAFYCIPANADMLAQIANEDILGLGRPNTAEDLAAAATGGRWTYETLLRYGALYGASSDAVGLAIASDAVSAAGLLYTSGVSLYEGERDNAPLYALAEQLSMLMRAKGVALEKENGADAVRARFTANGALFGGIVMLGSLEAADYRNDDGGVLILPVPVHMSGVEYKTHIHDVGRLVAISAMSDSFAPASALLNYQSTHSSAVLTSYFERELLTGALAKDGALYAANLSVLTYMRENVGGSRDAAIENAASMLASHMSAASPAGTVTFASLRWQDILASEAYDATYVRSYYRMLREEKLRVARLVYLNGATMLPR